MNLLIIGQGGREHAFFTKFQEDHPEKNVKILPGNGGINRKDRIAGSSLDFPYIEKLISRHSFDNILVGPELPLVDGIVDYFKGKNVYVFGPSKQAALLEGSKAFSKDFMKKYQIPTAEYETFEDLPLALEYAGKQPLPIVIKASGLAAGKGVTICHDLGALQIAIEESLSGRAFGDSGKKIVIEEWLTGEEVSIFAVCDGKNYQILGSAQDYKRAYDNDEGLNTGGMGAFSPSVILNVSAMDNIKKRVLEPTLSGLDKEGFPYTGILYLGLMMKGDDPFVIEYNCRMGDPEAQAVLPLLETPMAEIIDATRNQALDKIAIRHKEGFAVTVVLAKEGYPQNYDKGAPIEGLDKPMGNCKIFHAGTEFGDKKTIISNGGRVLNFTGMGKTLKDARENAYKAIAQINPTGFFYRKDIAKNVTVHNIPFTDNRLC